MSGWNDGLLQDYDRKLFNWFAGRLGAAYTLRKVNMSNEEDKTHRIPDAKALLDELIVVLVEAHPEHSHYEPTISHLVGKLQRALAAPLVQPRTRTTGYIAPRDRYVPPVLFNPYSGEPRDVRDVQSDPQGILIVPPGAALLAAPRDKIYPSGSPSEGVQAPVDEAPSGDRDAYEGCREDLLDWKRRALKAEADLRKCNETCDNLTRALAEEVNGLTFMGEPVVHPQRTNESQSRFSACDMTEAAAQGFRDGQAAPELTDERIWELWHQHPPNLLHERVPRFARAVLAAARPK